MSEAAITGGAAITIEELQVLITANTKEMKQQLATMKNQFKGLNKSAKTMTAGIRSSFKKLAVFIAALGIGRLLQSSIKTAMDAIESENLFDTVMGRWIKSVRAWSMELQKTLGLNAYEVRKNVGVLFNMTKSMGLAENSALDMSKQLTELAYDMASFYNVSADEAFNKLKAGITGETEPLKRLGIIVQENVIKQVAYKNGIATVGAELTEQQKVMARYLAIMEQTKTAQGDLARTIKSPANQLRILKTQLEVVRINLGKAFMPITQIVLPLLTNLVTQLATVTSYFTIFMEALFGIEQKADSISQKTSNISSGLANMGDSAKEASEKVKGSLTGFDEINKLAQNTKTSTLGEIPDLSNIEIGGNSVIAETSLEFKTNIDETKIKIQQQAKQIKKIVADLKTFIVKNSDEIISAFAGIGTAFATFKIITNWTTIVEGIKLAFTGLATAIGAVSIPALIVATVIGSIVGGLIYLWKTNKRFKDVVTTAWKNIKTNAIEVFGKVKEVIAELWETKLKPFSKWLSEKLVLAWRKVIEVSDWLWKEVLTPIGQFLLWFKDNVIKPLADILEDVLGSAFGFVKDIALILWKNVLVPFGEFISTNFVPLIEMLSAVFTFLWENVLKPFAGFIENVFKSRFEELVKVLEFLWYDVLKPLTVFMGGAFIQTFEKTSGLLKNIIDGFKVSFNGLLNFITGVFTGDWERAWNGVKDIFKGVFDSLVGIVKRPLNRIIDAINTVIRGIKKVNASLPDSMSIDADIKEIPHLARGGITGVNKPFTAVVGDNPTQREVVSPLGDLMNMITTAVNGSSGGGNTTVVVKIGEDTIMEKVISGINRQSRINGATVVEV